MSVIQKLRLAISRTVARRVGFGNPPPGWWIETDGKRWRWAHEEHAWTFPTLTRAGAVRNAWWRYDRENAQNERLASLRHFRPEVKAPALPPQTSGGRR